MQLSARCFVVGGVRPHDGKKYVSPGKFHVDPPSTTVAPGKLVLIPTPLEMELAEGGVRP